MSVKHKVTSLLALLVVSSLVLSACSEPEPEVVEKVVTQVVKETVVETVVEEKEVEVEVTKEVLVSSRGMGGTLTLLYWQAASTLNPYLALGDKDRDPAALVLEPLARRDDVGNFVPWLAKEIPTAENGDVAEDFSSITWRLRDDILWSDGTPFTAEDVVFTVEYCLDPETGCTSLWSLEDVESIEALDQFTVRINFAQPKPFPYDALVGMSAPVLQKAQFADCIGAAAVQCTEQNNAPIGTGPYKVTEFRADDVVVYEANENYRDPNKPFFSEVIIKGGGDASSAARAVLETGEADWAWNLQIEPQVLAAMESRGLGKLQTVFGTSVEFIWANFTNPDPALGDKRSVWSEDDPNPHPFLSDPVVRRALSLAIDRATIATKLYGEAGKPVCNYVAAPPAYVSTANDECLEQNIELANQILDEAGWLRGPDGIREKDGVRLSILYQTSTNAVRQGTQALIKQWWGEIGVETELRNIPANVFFSNDPASPDTVAKFYADIQMYTVGSGADPVTHLKTYKCEEIPTPDKSWLGGNRIRWCNPEFDALVDEALVTAGLEQRAAMAKQLNDMLIQDYAAIPLVLRGFTIAYKNDLLGVRMSLWDSAFWNIADWTRAGY